MKKKVIRLEEIVYEDFLNDILTLRPPKSKIKEKVHPELMTLSETAAFFKVSKKTIFNWCENKVLRKIVVGNRVYFSREAIEEVIEKNRV